MALEEVSFFNIFGEEVNLSNLVNQMINYYRLKLEVGETQITDFNEGSEIRNILEAIAVMSFAILEDENEAGKLPFIRLSYGTYLDRIGENPFIELPRIQGQVSKGIVTFTLAFAQDTDIIIPAQTLLEDNIIGLEFVTDEDLTIYAGDLSSEISASCLSEGTDGNIKPGQLTVISDDNIDTSLISVNNTEDFTGGTNYEDDEEYRTRLLENVRADGFGTIGYYTKLGTDVEGVHDVKLISDLTYTRKVLVNGYTKPTPDSVLLDVLIAFSIVDDIVLGHSFTVDRPSYQNLNLTFDLDVLTEFSNTDLTSLITAIVNGGEWDRMEFPGLMIGENLTRDLLVESMNFIDDIVNISVKQTGQSSEFSSTDISVNQVVKLGTLTFNQTVME